MNARRTNSPGPKNVAARMSSESPLADFLTVGWMLAVMTTLLCELGAVIATVALQRLPDSRPLQSLVDVLLFAALVVGLAAVAFLPILRQLRKTGPPKPIAWLALTVGLAPIVVMLVRAVR